MQVYRSKLSSPPTKQDLLESLIGKTAGSDVIRSGSPAEVLCRLSTVEICRELASWQTARNANELSASEVVRGAFSGGELAGAFDGIFGSTLAGAYAAADCKSAGWTAEIKELENYEVTRITRVFDNILLLPRGREPAEIQSLLGYSVEWAATEYAKSLIVDEQDLINDLTHAILQAAAGLGRGAVRLRDDAVFSLILRNPILPSDNLPVFDPGHNNLLSGVGSALSNTSLAQGIAAIRSQTIDTPDGIVHLELRPAYLVVPPALEDTAKQTLRLQKLDNDRIDLQLIVTSRLSSVGVADPLDGTVRKGIDSNWMLTGDARTGPSFAVGFLKGQDKPELRSANLPISANFSGQWGKSWDVRQAIAVAALDFCGAVWSVGQ